MVSPKHIWGELMPNLVRIHYDGLDATNHILDLRAFGHAAIGFDQVANMGLIALSDLRLPKKGERFPLRIVANEPKEGSFEFAIELAALTTTMLPIVHGLFNTMASELLWRWISWVTNATGGRKRAAEMDMEAMLPFVKEIHRSHAESEERWQQFTLELLDKAKEPAKQFVAPIGTSSDTVKISTRGKTQLLTHLIDTPMADAIRSKEKLEVGDMEVMRLKVDGLIHHNKQLKVENPDHPGKFITANVRDPAFDEEHSIYTDAVAMRGILEVSAKPSRTPQGELKYLYIMDALSLSES